MSATETQERIGYAQRDLYVCRDDVNGWKKKHKDLGRCWFIEDIINRLNGLYHRILLIDEWYHHSLYLAPESYDVATESVVFSLFREWLSLADVVGPEAESAATEYGCGQDLEAFRRAVNEARSILSDDAHLYDGNRLESLEKQALAEHKAGRTKPLHFG